jgi:hypothetical protein
MMPSTSKKQRNFMAAVAHNPAFAKKAGVPQSVGKDFNEADKGRKFSKGGNTMAENKKLSFSKSAKDYKDIMDDVAQVEAGIYTDPKTGKQMSRVRGLGPSMAAQRLEKDSDKGRFAMPGQGDVGQFLKKGGNVKKMNMGGYADGGMPMVMKDGKKVPTFAADGVGKMAKGGMAKGGMKHEDVKMDKKMMQKAVNKHEGRLHKGSTMTKLASGGMAPSKMGAVKTSKKIDGIATKGKTKGTMIAMKNGGKC